MLGVRPTVSPQRYAEGGTLAGRGGRIAKRSDSPMHRCHYPNPDTETRVAAATHRSHSTVTAELGVVSGSLTTNPKGRRVIGYTV
jgi:hypothetical protein